MSQIAKCTTTFSVVPENANCKLVLQLVFGILFLLGGGCAQSGPEVAPVKGRVTLDGRPLANVGVEFQPNDMKRPAYGGTDENGEYQLYYNRGILGARVGQHIVRILAPVESKAAVIPDRYNKQSELRAEVKPGQNEINFDLKSDSK